MNILKLKAFSVLLFFFIASILLFMATWNYNFKTKMNQINDTETKMDRNFILFDLGSNNGDSILSFFELQPRLPQFVEKRFTYKTFGSDAITAQWKIYAFEANSNFDSDLDETVLRINKYTNHHIKVFKQTAAWTYDGKIGFYVENVTGFGVGSSIDKKHPDVIKTDAKETLVNCRDIANIVKKFGINDFIVMKIDIEGAEYELILDFIKKDAIRWVDHFAVEYHSQLKKFESPESVLNSILILFGASFSRWII